MATQKSAKSNIDPHTQKHIFCKFCGKPNKNYNALCAHLRFCKKRFESIIIRFVDGDLWIKGNSIALGIVREHLLDESFDSAYATVEEKKALIKGVILIGRHYGKNIITKAEWGSTNSFDKVATGETEIYEV